MTGSNWSFLQTCRHLKRKTSTDQETNEDLPKNTEDEDEDEEVHAVSNVSVYRGFISVGPRKLTSEPVYDQSSSSWSQLVDLPVAME